MAESFCVVRTLLSREMVEGTDEIALVAMLLSSLIQRSHFP
jgi:hypothetical protein